MSEQSSVPQSDFRPQGFSQYLPSSPAEVPQTYAWLAQMRAHSPVLYIEQMNIWLALRYEDVARVLTDHATFSSSPYDFPGSFLSDTLIAKDPPDHRQLRNLVNMAFTPRAV